MIEHDNPQDGNFEASDARLWHPNFDRQKIPADIALVQVARDTIARLVPVYNGKDIAAGGSGDTEAYLHFDTASDRVKRFTIKLGEIDQIVFQDMIDIDGITFIGIRPYSDGSPYSYSDEREAFPLDIILGLEAHPFIADIDNFEDRYERPSTVNKLQVIRDYLEALRSGEDLYHIELDDEACANLISSLEDPDLEHLLLP